MLLGVATSAGPAGSGDPLQELTLQPLEDYSAPSDNVIMTCVAGTAGGRIFMGGADGRLYELKYGGGRGGKCRKVPAHGSSGPDERTVLLRWQHQVFSERDLLAAIICFWWHLQ